MDLIRCCSVTPEDAGCQTMLASRLQPLGFVANQLPFGAVDNLWITHGQGDPVFAFLGHTDVVPTGPLEKWSSPPFSPEIRDGKLYGRGAADMKGSIAAFVTALEKFINQHPNHPGTIAMLITSDEEGPATNGTCKVMEHLQDQGLHIKWCLVGEPSSEKKLGDVIKNGRRGSLGGRLIIHGIQGHVAYPHLAQNPIHQCSPALSELCAKSWDEGNEFYPPTTFQISNINAGTGATNVIPETLEIIFNYRFGTVLSPQQLISETEQIITKHCPDHQLDWTISGMPFLTTSGKLLNAAQQAIREIVGYETRPSTAGGTSDGRFVAPTGAEIIELGPLNETIHQINECVSVDDLELLAYLYGSILLQLYDT